MADHLMEKVRDEKKSIRTITVKVRYNAMGEDQRSESLAEPTDLETDVYSRLDSILRRAWKRRVSLRLVCLKFSNVYESFCRAELSLDAPSRQREQRRHLAHALDDLRGRLGNQAVMRGHNLFLRERKVEDRKPNALPPALHDATAPYRVAILKQQRLGPAGFRKLSTQSVKPVSTLE